MSELPWPFVGSEPLSTGIISERRAMRRLYEPVYPNVYTPRHIEVPARASAGGHDNRRPPPDLVVRTERVLPDEIVELGGMRVTTPARAAFDLGCHITSRILAVQRVDALADATDVKPFDIEAVIAAHPGARGLPRVHHVLPLMDSGAESPQETVARLVLIDAGLPPPKTQFNVFDEFGQFVARLDMAYDEVKVGIEYDGSQHWSDPAVRQRDIDAQFALNELGWLVIRVSRDLLRYRRATYVARVESALHSRDL